MGKILSGLYTSILNIAETIGTARAANALAVMGYHKEAKNLMVELKNND